MGGPGARAVQMRACFAWFADALAENARVPLAPRLVFPPPTGGQHAFLFVDASRSWGIGGWTLAVESGVLTARLYAAPYPADLRATAADIRGVSTGVLELAAAQVALDSIGEGMGVTHFTLFIDNEAAKFALNAGSSASPPMRDVLGAALRQAQLLAVRCPTELNVWADDLSRGRGEAVAAAAEAFGLRVRWFAVGEAQWAPLRSAARTSAEARE